MARAVEARRDDLDLDRWHVVVIPAVTPRNGCRRKAERDQHRQRQNPVRTHETSLVARTRRRFHAAIQGVNRYASASSITDRVKEGQDLQDLTAVDLDLILFDNV